MTMYCVERVLLVEGRLVSVTASYAGSGPRIDVGFALTASRDGWLAGYVEDPHAEMAGWKNPVLALTAIGQLALETAQEMFAANPEAEVATFTGCDAKRTACYFRMLARAGVVSTRYYFDDGDFVPAIRRPNA